jgi:NAD(P)-dependent dehydrogenase (short-subunit alcohol dehydrogenase family)
MIFRCERIREESMRLEDKVAIVTGAASGMGAATARLFAREGAKVMLTDVLESEGREVMPSITASDGQHVFSSWTSPARRTGGRSQ